MKKLLKSVLIATSSIGTIAGATVAVVSCGKSEMEMEIDLFVEVWNRLRNSVPLVTAQDNKLLEIEVLLLANLIIGEASTNGTITLLTTVTAADLHLPSSYTPGPKGTIGEIKFTITFHNINDLTKTYESPTLILLVQN